MHAYVTQLLYFCVYKKSRRFTRHPYDVNPPLKRRSLSAHLSLSTFLSQRMRHALFVCTLVVLRRRRRTHFSCTSLRRLRLDLAQQRGGRFGGGSDRCTSHALHFDGDVRLGSVGDPVRKSCCKKGYGVGMSVMMGGESR